MWEYLLIWGEGGEGDVAEQNHKEYINLRQSVFVAGKTLPRRRKMPGIYVNLTEGEYAQFMRVKELTGVRNSSEVVRMLIREKLVREGVEVTR